MGFARRFTLTELVTCGVARWTEEIARREKEKAEYSAGMWVRINTKRSISLRKVEILDGEVLRDLNATTKAFAGLL